MQLPDKLFGPDMISDPYPVYQELRTSSPVHWDSGLNAWVVTRYHDVAMILTDQRFSARRVEKGRKRFPQPEFEPLFDTLAELGLHRIDENPATLLFSLQVRFSKSLIPFI